MYIKFLQIFLTFYSVNIWHPLCQHTEIMTFDSHTIIDIYKILKSIIKCQQLVRLDKYQENQIIDDSNKIFSAENQFLSDHSLLCMTYNDFFVLVGYIEKKNITKSVAFFFSFSLCHAKEENNHRSIIRAVHRGWKAVATVPRCWKKKLQRRDGL